MTQSQTTKPAARSALDAGGIASGILGAGVGFVAGPVMTLGGLNWILTELFHQARVSIISGQGGMAILMYGAVGAAIVGGILAIVARATLASILVAGLQRLAQARRQVSSPSGVGCGLLVGAVASLGGGLAGGLLIALLFAAG